MPHQNAAMLDQDSALVLTSSSNRKRQTSVLLLDALMKEMEAVMVNLLNDFME